jgi:Zn-dependent protease
MTSLLNVNNPVAIFIAITIFLSTIAVLVSVHEAAHAWTANKLGDPTAKHQGRVSLNPMVHIDPLGTVILPLFLIVVSFASGGPFFLFGWAKPTPFNPWNLQNPRRDAALISFAGPVSNFAIAVLIAVIYRALPISNELFLIYLQFLLTLTLILGIFNLIPIAPLDGFKVVTGLLPKKLALQWEELERIGPFLLIALIFFGGAILRPIIGTLMNFFLSILIG